MKFTITIIISLALIAGCSVTTDDQERVSEAEQAASSLAGTWEGVATYVGPPFCPFGVSACDHETTIYIGCSGAAGYAVYHYPELNLTCHSDLKLKEVGGRYQYWYDTTEDCVDGEVTIGPAMPGGGLGFRWEHAQTHDEDTVGTLHRTQWAICVQ